VCIQLSTLLLLAAAVEVVAKMTGLAAAAVVQGVTAHLFPAKVQAAEHWLSRRSLSQ
jgi:hypothetical protein